ncbi:MAG: hypothetical protein LBS76_04630 [Mycoplasmataceae bacterium]|jgi:hypothetical protein|nr:hypothetical protein [Mycoplasmataceae bacterium]
MKKIIEQPTKRLIEAMEEINDMIAKDKKGKSLNVTMVELKLACCE